MRGAIALATNAALLAVSIALPTTTTTAGAASAPATNDGVVFAYGLAQFGGSPGATPPGALVGIAGVSDGSGYWVLRADGGVYHYGSARWYGAPDTLPGGIPSPAAAIAADPAGDGYWVVARAGQVYAYGGVTSHGSVGANGGIVGIAATPTGLGYWITDATGGVFTFGDAGFHGSAYGSAAAHGGIVAIAATSSGKGYWLAAADGTVFGYGDAAVYGSAWGVAHHPIVGIASTFDGGGYWLADSAGTLYRYGDAAMSAAPQIPDPRIRAPGHTVPLPASADNGVVHSPSIAIDRHVAAIATASGLHSLWVLSDQDPSNTILESLGARGSAVTAIQQMLVARGFWVPVTGVFDNDTQQAVWAFQKYWGFSRTGYITAGDYRALRVAPRVHARSTSGTLVEVDKTRQVLFLVQNGVTVWAWNTSTGSGKSFTEGGTTRVATTPEGVFHIIRQVDGLDVGPLGALWRPKYFTPDGVAIHGNPSVPPYPASHGCARVSNDAIDYLWATGSLPIGLEVWVY